MSEQPGPFFDLVCEVNALRMVVVRLLASHAKMHDGIGRRLLEKEDWDSFRSPSLEDEQNDLIGLHLVRIQADALRLLSEDQRGVQPL